MRKERVTGEFTTFKNVDDVWDFMHFEKGTVYYRNGDDLTLCKEMNDPLNGTYEVWFGETKVTDEHLNEIVGFLDYKKKIARNEIYKVGNAEYLLLPDDTLVAMLFVGEIPIYWLDGKHAVRVNDAKTIYGGSPHNFGIKIR